MLKTAKKTDKKIGFQKKLDLLLSKYGNLLCKTYHPLTITL